MTVINQISLNPSAIARALGAVAIFLLLVSIGGQWIKFELGHEYDKGFVPIFDVFDVDGEQNIPTYFSVLLLLTAALLLAVIAVFNGKQGAPHTSNWATLSLGFLFMSYDEAFRVHESLNVPVRSLLGNGNLGFFNFAWVIPGLAVVLVLALFFLRFLLHLDPTTRLRFLMAATLYIGGAIGFEMIGGRYVGSYDMQTLAYNMITTVEESLEMAGLILFIWALLMYCADNYKDVRFRFDDVAEESTSKAS